MHFGFADGTKHKHKLSAMRQMGHLSRNMYVTLDLQMAQNTSRNSMQEVDHVGGSEYIIII